MNPRQAVVACSLLVLGACTPVETPPSAGAPSNAVVTRVVDGDTIEVETGGRELTVRLIGVDTPETVHPSEGVECFGKAASAFTERSLQGRQVRLEFDEERLDRYERTLAYVWLDGRMFNETLVREGYASAYPYPPNTRYADRFAAAERAAREAERGMWGSCSLGQRPAAAPALNAAGGRRCDPSYPRVCIPPPPPDLDCADVRFHDFRVRGPDPHLFDADGNGRGCES